MVLSIRMSLGSAVLVGVLLAVVARRLFFSPLARLPGPRLAALTKLWIMFHEFTGNRTLVIDKLHSRYGPVVRISPDEVSFNNYDAVKDIYGIKSDFSKSDFYDMFVYYNERNTFTSLSKQEHSATKRLVADRYSKSFVTQAAVCDRVREHVSSFMQIVQKSARLDVYTYLHYFAMDVITNHVYGRYGTRTLTDSEQRPLVYDLSGQKHRTRLYLLYYFKTIMSAISLISRIGKAVSNGKSDFHVRGTRLNAYGKTSVASFRETELGTDRISTCSKLFEAIPDNDLKIAAECMDHLVAGVDTTGDAMCILMWKLSTPEGIAIQDKIYQELRAHCSFEGTSMTTAFNSLDSLPYLDAVIREGLRWRAPVPMTLFRVIPQGSPRLVAGTLLPAGTTVGCQGYSLHRAPGVFDDPDTFKPERWLTDDKEKLSAMKALFWPFSSGARHCLGHNIAMVEMKMIIASVYAHYRSSTAATCTEESMRMDDQLTSGIPYGMRCELEFHARQGT